MYLSKTTLGTFRWWSFAQARAETARKLPNDALDFAALLRTSLLQLTKCFRNTTLHQAARGADTSNMSSTASQRALDYLEQLPGLTFNKLYQQPSTALAIFRRMLPHLAKTLVMAMLYMPTAFAAADLDAWVKPDAESLQARDRALSILQRLRILEDSGREYKLADAFARSLRLALTGGGNHRSFGVPCSTPDKTPVTVDYLDTFARRQWEAILYYVVGSANTGLGGEVDISAGTKQLLQRGEFVALRGRTALITQAGFTFLLQEINAQIWTLLIVYLETSSSVRRPRHISYHY